MWYDNYNKSIYSYFGINLIYAALGIVIGTIAKRVGVALNKDKNLTVLSLGINTLIAISIFYIIEQWISYEFVQTWQSTTPGIMFITLYFAVQAEPWFG